MAGFRDVGAALGVTLIAVSPVPLVRHRFWRVT
jgi:hypothetical protein